MKKIIFRYLLVVAAIAPTIPLTICQPAQAQSSDSSMPTWIQPYKDQLWNPQGLLTLAALGIGGYVVMSGDNGKKNKNGRMASAHWARRKEKQAAQKVAIRQINDRKRDGLTTWVNTPLILPLKKPRGNVRYNITPTANTIFIPDGQRGTTVCGAPGSGKTFSVIDPMVRSVIDQGFPICLYDFKFPSGQAEIHAAYAKNLKG